ncbi:MAG: hypothetical protein ACYC64_00425 [Armatimonadota bacterium]
MNELLFALEQHGLTSGRFIILNLGADGSPIQMVEITDFEGLFGSTFAEDNVYPALLAADDNGDGTTKGYKRFFDAWHAAGII